MKEISSDGAARPARSSELFAKTRTTLLRRVNAGDCEAFEEFYNLYAPAMLKYLGFSSEAATERDQLDIVQTVFAKFYKAFALVEDPDTGKKRVPRNIFEALCKPDKKTGKSHTIRFRQYLITCMKNAVRAKWRADTAKGKMSYVSVDEKIKPESDATWADIIADFSIDPKAIAVAEEDRESLSAVWYIWRAVIKAVALDESMDDAKRDIVYRSFAEGAKAEELAANWGLTENNVYVIKSRAKDMAKSATRAVFKMLAAEDVEIGEAAEKLYKAVAASKPRRRGRFDKFIVGLAKELVDDLK
jgi:DNA-directed RNA polymerase specialized sigma24 family protein